MFQEKTLEKCHAYIDGAADLPDLSSMKDELKMHVEGIEEIYVKNEMIMYGIIYHNRYRRKGELLGIKMMSLKYGENTEN